MDNSIIVSLSAVEKKWWQDTIKKFRTRMIEPPSAYVDQALMGQNISIDVLRENVEILLIDSRERVYELFLKAEAKLNAVVISHLIEIRMLPKTIFSDLIDAELIPLGEISSIDEAFKSKLANVVGTYTGLIFPYLYELNLSSTNSRRSRAGATFEMLIEKALEIYGYPFQNQSSLGTDFFKTNRIGKKVDLIIPGRSQYESRRPGCAIVSVKTSLRERWQEVVEELQRSNVPHIYLATLDEGITLNQIEIMKAYNITLVVRESEKIEKFGNTGTVDSFQTFYDRTIPHILQGWPEFRIEK